MAELASGQPFKRVVLLSPMHYFLWYLTVNLEHLQLIADGWLQLENLLKPTPSLSFYSSCVFFLISSNL